MSNGRHRRVIVVGLGWLAVVWCLGRLSLGGAWALEPVRIQVRTAARAAGDSIFLKEVAVIEAPDALKNKIGQIRVDRSPLPGKEKIISGRRMMSILKAAKIIPAEAVVSAPESIRIEREFQAVQEERLGEMFYRFVAEVLNAKQFRVSRFKVRGVNRFPTGKLDVTIAPFDRSELIGNVGLKATVRVDGKKCGRLTLLAWVDRFEPVVCASRAVAHNTVLTEADLSVTTVNIAEFPPGTLTDVKEVIGQKAKVTIRPGTPIRTAMLAPAPLVQKGERVKIVAASGRLKVAAMGIAKTSGGMGEQIQVENVTSNKTIVGRVTGESTVAVLF